MRRSIIVAGASTALFVSTIASATETITYTYDARGRLIQILHSGSVNNGVNSSYAYDKANNRITRTTTGAP